MADDLVPTTAHHNYLVPTQHEAFSLFDGAYKTLVDQLDQIRDTVFAYQRRALATTYEIVPEGVTAGDADYMVAQADFSGKIEATLSTSKRAHAQNAAVGAVKIVGGVFALLLVALIARVDYALFVALFREGYLNQYGELPADMMSVVTLIALQAVIAILGLHLFLNSARRRAIAATAVAVLIMIFLIGVVIHRGETELARMTNVAIEPLGWNIPVPASPLDGRESALETVAVVALGIPYLVLPLVGALLASLGLIAIKEGLGARAAHKLFKEGYAAREADINAAWTHDALAKKLHQDWPAYVKAPVMKLVDERVEKAAILSEWSAKSKAFGFPGSSRGLIIPGTVVGTLDDPDYVARLATEARAVLGAGFVDREFNAWRVSRGKTSDRLGGM